MTFTPIGEIVRKITVEIARDPVFECWAGHAKDLSDIPPPSMFARCREIGATDELMTRLVCKAAFEGKLRGYAKGERFLDLVRYYVTKGAA
jgi:hypothetical protein